MSDQRHDPLARLVRLADQDAPDVRPAAMRRARMAVELEWRRGLHSRRRRRLAVGGGAGVLLAAAAALVLWLTVPAVRLGFGGSEDAAYAEVVRGSLSWQYGPAGVGTRLAPGSELRTGPDESAALRLADGRSLRLAPDTRARFAGGARLSLDAGALYVDSPPAAPGLDALVIRTPHGEARNLATQFELRVGEDSLRLRVREGRVRLATPGQALEASAGMEIAWTPEKVETSTVPVRGDLWRPYVDLAHFDLEGATLAEFLAWVRRETGLAVAWSDPELEVRQRGVVLHGSLRGTPPHLAPAAVLPTCGLTAHIDDDTLFIRGVVQPLAPSEHDSERSPR